MPKLAGLGRATAFVVAFSLLGCATAQAGYLTGSEDVRGSRFSPEYTSGGVTYGPYGWSFSYTRGFDGTKLVKHLEIDFTFDTALNYDDAQKAAYRARIESNIEGIWNNRYMIVDLVTGAIIPILVDVTTAGPTFNQTVTVRKGSGRSNMLNWYEADSASTNAHEFGHMLGLFDEYIGGAVDHWPNPTLSNDGLMGYGTLSTKPVMYTRYYQQYLDYIRQLNPNESFALRAVPEPGSLALLAVGAGVLVGFRRRRVAVLAEG